MKYCYRHSEDIVLVQVLPVAAVQPDMIQQVTSNTIATVLLLLPSTQHGDPNRAIDNLSHSHSHSLTLFHPLPSVRWDTHRQSLLNHERRRDSDGRVRE